MGQFLTVFLQFLPVLLQFLNKSTEEQAEALPWAEALTRAAVKEGNAGMILAGGLMVRACKMPQDELQTLVSNVEQLQGAVAAAVAASADD